MVPTLTFAGSHLLPGGGGPLPGEKIAQLVGVTSVHLLPDPPAPVTFLLQLGGYVLPQAIDRHPLIKRRIVQSSHSKSNSEKKIQSQNRKKRRKN